MSRPAVSVVPAGEGKDAAPAVSPSDKLAELAAKVAPARVRVSNAVSDAWGLWLAEREWQWFCTFTFREDVHPERADKAFRVWCSKLNRHIYGARWYQSPYKGVLWARGLEWQRRGTLHYHALVARVGFTSRMQWMREWENLSGSYARILPPQDIGDVCAYVAKYITKGGEIDLSPSMVMAARQGVQASL